MEEETMKLNFKLIISLVVMMLVVFATVSCGAFDINFGFDTGKGNKEDTEVTYAEISIVDREVFALNAKGERVNVNRRFVEIEEKTYYVINNFAVVGNYVVDSQAYTFGEDGAKLDVEITNVFIECEGATYYIINNIVVYNMIVIDGAVYDFGEDGKMVVGEKGEYTFGEDGKLIANNIFITVKGATYYIVNNVTVYNMIVIDGAVYDFGEDGKMVIGDKGEYTFGEDGKLIANNIFITIEGATYYIVNNVTVYNMIVIDGAVYDFGEDGKMVVGEKGEYTYGEDGKLVANNVFITVNDATYYIINNITVYNMIVIDGAVYNFGDDGKMIVGVSGDYTFGEDGKLVATNIFITIKGATYYIINNITVYNFYEIGADGDSDGDGLSNRDEILYGTDPFDADSDDDGANDGREVFMGYDPLAPNTSFDVVTPPVIDNGSEPDSVIPTISIQLSGNQVNTLVVERDEFFDNDTLGYLGDAYRYDVEGEITSAVIGFEFDITMLGSNALPTIYAYDTASGKMVPLETTIVGNKATAEVSELSTFVLLDRYVYENELTWVDTWGVDGTVYSNIEIVFVIDDSGSMTSYDRSNQRLTVARDLIDQLPEGAKIGIVKFHQYTYYLTGGLVTGKDVAKSYLTTTNFKSNGSWTKMYTAMIAANGYFSTPTEDDGVMRIMVVLSDGIADDTGSMNSAINGAISAGISVYTVGLGAGNTNYFNSYLKPVSDRTGGNFYLASDANGLADIFDDIGEKIDLTTDTDGDGLLDYYEDNMVIFNGAAYVTDKNNPDTDGDGLLDGEEIVTIVIFSQDGKQMSVIGKVISDPTKADTDGDGVNDKEDAFPRDASAA